MPEMVDALLATARQRGAEVRTSVQVTGWGEEGSKAFVTVAHDVDRRYARRVLLAMGYGYHLHPELTALNLHALKGQEVIRYLSE